MKLFEFSIFIESLNNSELNNSSPHFYNSINNFKQTVPFNVIIIYQVAQIKCVMACLNPCKGITIFII